MTQKIITIKMSLEDAKTLSGLIDGCRGTSFDDHFTKFANRIIKKLDKETGHIVIKKKRL